MNEHENGLARLARHGDRAAFEELVRRTSRLVFARLYLDTCDPHLTEDLLQETYLRAFRSVHQLSDAEGFRSWLLAIAHSVLVDAARREARQKRVAPPRSELSVNAILGTGPPPEKEAERAETRRRVLAVLRSLPEDYRLPLTLRYIVGADPDAIETQLGITNGTLRGLLHRGLKMLRDRMPPDLAADLDR